MNRPRGFTLIELVIVVAVVAVLAAIALPNYNEHLRKTRRAQVKTEMLEVTQRLERRFTTDRDYTAEALCGQTLDSPASGGTVNYTVEIACTASTYTLTAEPQGNQTQDKCGELTLNHRGTKTADGSAPLSDCW